MGALAIATSVLSALPGLIQAGVNVLALINSTSATISKAQAENRDPTAAEWQVLDDMLSDLRKQAQA